MTLPLGLAFKNSLLTHNTFHTLLNEVTEVIKTIPNYENLKIDPEMLLLICRIVECKMGKNEQNIDKKDLVISILDKLFSLNDREKEIFKSNIQFLYDNGKIKKASFWKLCLYYISDWATRKIL